jgi:hypothetical protein
MEQQNKRLSSAIIIPNAQQLSRQTPSDTSSDSKINESDSTTSFNSSLNSNVPIGVTTTSDCNKTSTNGWEKIESRLPTPSSPSLHSNSDTIIDIIAPSISSVPLLTPPTPTQQVSPIIASASFHCSTNKVPNILEEKSGSEKEILLNNQYNHINEQINRCEKIEENSDEKKALLEHKLNGTIVNSDKQNKQPLLVKVNEQLSRSEDKISKEESKLARMDQIIEKSLKSSSNNYLNGHGIDNQKFNGEIQYSSNAVQKSDLHLLNKKEQDKQKTNEDNKANIKENIHSLANNLHNENSELNLCDKNTNSYDSNKSFSFEHENLKRKYDEINNSNEKESSLISSSSKKQKSDLNSNEVSNSQNENLLNRLNTEQQLQIQTGISQSLSNSIQTGVNGSILQQNNISYAHSVNEGLLFNKDQNFIGGDYICEWNNCQRYLHSYIFILPLFNRIFIKFIL